MEDVVLVYGFQVPGYEILHREETCNYGSGNILPNIKLTLELGFLCISLVFTGSMQC